MTRRKARSHNRQLGFGQLTLVEHSLCPLDPQSSLVPNLVHQVQHSYSDADRRRKMARVRVFSPLGLLPGDELYLWGLLALTLAQPESRPELVATPHWCLRELGLIDPKTRRGGRQYRQFAAALKRLSVVSYLSDAFYDPVRAEHRSVSFGLLSYDLPVDPQSSRAWWLTWDPTFFKFVQGAGGHLRFDLELYRGLDPASRRLFLFASKILSRREALPTLELRQLAIELLGAAPSLSTRDMKVKVSRCLDRLSGLGVVRDAHIEKLKPGEFLVRASRGSYFDRARKDKPSHSPVTNPLLDTLTQIGFTTGAAHRLMRRYPRRILEEWADITLAARERQGMAFFRKSPMAYFVDSVKQAVAGRRTPPDWWHELRRAERTGNDQVGESRQVFERIRSELFPTGRPEHDASGRPTDADNGLTLVGNLLCKE